MATLPVVGRHAADQRERRRRYASRVCGWAYIPLTGKRGRTAKTTSFCANALFGGLPARVAVVAGGTRSWSGSTCSALASLQRVSSVQACAPRSSRCTVETSIRRRSASCCWVQRRSRRSSATRYPTALMKRSAVSRTLGTVVCHGARHTRTTLPVFRVRVVGREEGDAHLRGGPRALRPVD